MAGIGTENMVILNTMVFGSLEFLFWYLPVFLLIYHLIPDKWKNAVLFGGSLILYGLGEPVYLFLLFGMSVVNYLFGLSLETGEETEQCTRRKVLLAATLVCNAGLLVYFKTAAAFDSVMLMPLGISFYLFKSISYLVDVYRGRITAERSLIRFGAYLSLFFQTVSGPIMRYEQMPSHMGERQERLHSLEEGLKWLICGLAAKVLIADRLAILWNDIQTIGFESISTPLAWFGMYGYSLQLYFDFAGYSMMAAGIGMMFGFPFIRNFEYPYAASCVSAFYRRWHMTLGSWFRDYVYIPLGGSRGGMGKTVCSVLAVWLLTGFWHGAGFHFWLWGIILGIIVLSEKIWLGKILQKNRIFAHLYVLLMIPMTWMVFAIDSLDQIGIYFARLFPFFGVSEAVNTGDFLKELTVLWPVLTAGVLFCIPAVGNAFLKRKNTVWVNLLLFGLFWLCVYTVSNAVNNPFMYAAF